MGRANFQFCIILYKLNTSFSPFLGSKIHILFRICPNKSLYFSIFNICPKAIENPFVLTKCGKWCWIRLWIFKKRIVCQLENTLFSESVDWRIGVYYFIEYSCSVFPLGNKGTFTSPLIGIIAIRLRWVLKFGLYFILL